MEELVLCSGNSNREIADEMARELNVQLTPVEISRFSNGEIYVRFEESVRGAHVFLVQTLSTPVNEYLMELLIMLDALKRASPQSISVVMPHYAYSRQDKQAAAREPISAKLVADLLTVAGAKRLLTIDLHAGQIQGYFDFPVDHLTARPVLINYFREKKLKDLVVVSPDVGRVKVAKKFADRVGADLAVLHKERPAHNIVEVQSPGKMVVGEIEGKNVIIVDDMIDTGGTIIEGARALHKEGAKSIYVAATHGLLTGPAIERLSDPIITEIVLTNTLIIPAEKKLDKMTILSVGPLFAEAIAHIYRYESVSAIFEGGEQL